MSACSHRRTLRIGGMHAPRTRGNCLSGGVNGLSTPALIRSSRRRSLAPSLICDRRHGGGGLWPTATDARQDPDGITPLLGRSFFDRRRRGEVVEHRRNSTISNTGGGPARGEPKFGGKPIGLKSINGRSGRTRTCDPFTPSEVLWPCSELIFNHFFCCCSCVAQILPTKRSA